MRKRCERPSCGGLTRWSKDERRCVCRDDSYWDDDMSRCQQIDCGIGMKYDARAGSCINDPNYKHECPNKMKW